MFAAGTLVLLNKCDLIDVFEFKTDYFRRGPEMVNPGVPFFPISCRSAGMAEWMAWLVQKATERS